MTNETPRKRLQGSPAAMMAVPESMLPAQMAPSPDTPRRGITLLEEITRWHGARSFHWSTAWPNLRR